MNSPSVDAFPPLISDVSDTALWTAACRAMESRRADALFDDPFAARLAGERGQAIAAQAPWHSRDWPVVVRTKSIDDLVMASLAEGCDSVLSLAAGFDTRPYRLDLPSELTWIEVDLPALIDAKERLLAGERPRCRLSRERADLVDAAARASLLDRLLANATKTLVITEGLLMYLSEDEVRAIASDFLRRPITWWTLDILSPMVRDMVMRGMDGGLDNAPMKFAPPDGVAFFEASGWRVRDILSLVKEARRLRRLPWLLQLLASLPQKTPDPRDVAKTRWSAVIRLER